MRYSPLQVSKVSGPRVISRGPQYYHGFTSFVKLGASDKLFSVSDSSAAGTTGTDIKTHVTLRSGNSRTTEYINSVWPNPVRIDAGLRVNLVDWRAGGTTVYVHFHG